MLTFLAVLIHCFLRAGQELSPSQSVLRHLGGTSPSLARLSLWRFSSGLALTVIQHWEDDWPFEK